MATITPTMAATTPDTEKASLTDSPSEAGPTLDKGKAAQSSSIIMRLYSKPIVQVSLMALTCFMCPGMFNALSGMGGGGQISPKAQNNAATALYSMFAVFAFFGGTICNRLGSRLTLGLGALGYALYIGSFLSYNINQNESFVIAAGAILGICAAMLWTAQGSIMLSYSTEQSKGRFIAVFWTIFNLGAVIGAAIELGLSWDSGAANSVSNETYIVFLVLAASGALIPFILRDPSKMVRDDGTRVTVRAHPTWISELKGLFVTLRTEPWILLLFPFFLASNWFYTWQFNDFNGPLFTLRARALNNLCYWASQMGAAWCIGLVLDTKRWSRRARAYIGWSITFVLVMVVWGSCYYKQTFYNRDDVATKRLQRVDVKDHSQTFDYGSLLVLYIFCGVMDAVWQCFAYYLIGAISNDMGKLAYIAGFYKSIQSAGAAGVSALDNRPAPYMTMVIVAWVLCVAGLLGALPVIAMRVNEHTLPEQEKLVNDAEVVAEADSDIQKH